MNPEEVYIQQVLDRVPRGETRRTIEADLRSHIADRLERGGPVDDALRSLGDPKLLAESYLAAVPLVAAPFGRRAFAKLVDTMILGYIPAFVFAFAIFMDLPNGGKEPFDDPIFAMAAAALFLLSVIAACLYTMIAEYRSGQTIGKRLFRLQVVTESGTRISLGQAFVRQLPLFLEIFLVDCIFALFTAKRQRAFELVSRTRVVLLPGTPEYEAAREMPQTAAV